MPAPMGYRISNPVAHIDSLPQVLSKAGERAATGEKDLGVVFSLRVGEPVQIPTVADDEISGDQVGSDGRAWANVWVAGGEALLGHQQTYEEVLEEGLEGGNDVQEEGFVDSLDIAAGHGALGKQPLHALPRSIKASQSFMELFG